MEFFNNFAPRAPIAREHIERYGPLVAPEIAEMWTTLGTGIANDGLLRVIDPAWVDGFLSHLVTTTTAMVPVFMTAFGDVIVSQQGTFNVIFTRYGSFDTFAPAESAYLPAVFRVINDPSPTYLAKVLRSAHYQAAAQRLGIPEINECFGHVPLLSLGGPDIPDTLQRVKVREHLLLAAAMQGLTTTFTLYE